MLEQAHLDQIRHRIGELERQREHCTDNRIRRTLDGLLNNEQRRLEQWERLHSIWQSDGE